MISVSRRHDLSLLVDLAVRVNPGFTQWLDTADGLTPYATAFRYPGEVLAPSANEFQKALQGAEGLYAFVLSTLPNEVYP